MDYQEYKKEFLTELRNESAISGSDTGDEFVAHTLEILSGSEWETKKDGAAV